MEMKQIKLKIYLYHRKTPITAILPNKQYVERLLDELNSTKDYVTFGEIIFKRTDVRLCVTTGQD